MTFTHLDANLHPAMVDIGDKVATQRTATAEAQVRFPPAVAAALRDSGLRSPKGPVFDTAIVAGVMGAKRTHELIPFCHPLGLENCRICIDLDGDTAVIRCTVSVHHKTGVGNGGPDRRQHLRPDRVRHVQGAVPRHRHRRLAPAREGRREKQLRLEGSAMTHANPDRPESASAPVYGLILAGGSSSRMHRDKAALQYRGKSQLDRAFELASRHVSPVFVSVRANQTADPTRAQRPMIVDSVAGEGPIVGIRSALAAYPHVAWMVLACDLPFLSDAVLSQLLRERDLGRVGHDLSQLP